MMSRVPMLSDEAAIWNDIELAAQAKIFLMGSGADLIASLFNISRDDDDIASIKVTAKGIKMLKLKITLNLLSLLSMNINRLIVLRMSA